MTADFWAEVWESGRTGFHRAEPHPHLIANAEKVFAGAGRVLVPLCGRTPDLGWLAERYPEVVGVEFVETAVTGYAAANGLVQKPWPPFRAYARGALTVLLGDFFAATPANVGLFDAIWDRAALVALDVETRPRYAQACQLLLAPAGRILVSSFEFTRGDEGGPPYTVTASEIRRLYQGFTVTKLSEQANDDRKMIAYELAHSASSARTVQQFR